jgi:hypothetical protein
LDGELAWSQDNLLHGGGERAFASFLVMRQSILMLNDGGELILFGAKLTGFEVMSRAQACGATWCSPAYADGRLYVRDSRALFCLELIEPGSGG